MNGLTSIGKQQEEDGKADVLDAVLHDESRDVFERISAGFARGRECDRHGDYNAAFAAYSLANLLSRSDGGQKVMVSARRNCATSLIG
jgi:hypothetical protein